MMTANNIGERLDESQYARAITRWENEGGAPGHGISKTEAKRRVDVENVQGAFHAARATVSVRPDSQS